MNWQVWISWRTPPKVHPFLHKLAAHLRNAGHRVDIGERHIPGRALALYGMGGADRWDVANEQIARGLPLMVWDAGYWNRLAPDTLRSYRVSFGGMHCPQLMAQGPRPRAERFAEARLRITDHGGTPSGPVVVIGHSPKSTRVNAQGWTAAKVQEVRAHFPGVPVLYRAKPKHPHEDGVRADGLAEGPIEQVLAGARLVVCRHSNVAVDAALMGVPAVCEDGAGAVIYPAQLADWRLQPLRAEREAFLHRVAWWQWSGVDLDQHNFWQWARQYIE